MGGEGSDGHMLANCLNCGAKKLSPGPCERCGWDNNNPSCAVVQAKRPRLRAGVHWANILSLLLSAPLLDGALMVFAPRPKEEVGVALEATLFLWLVLFIPAMVLAVKGVRSSPGVLSWLAVAVWLLAPCWLIGSGFLLLR